MMEKSLGTRAGKNATIIREDQTMTNAAIATAAPLDPGAADRAYAESASRALSLLAGQDRVRVEAVADNPPAQTFVLPATAVRLLTDMLAHLAQGRGVTVFPEEAELTTQEAADMLNVSRPHLVALLERGILPFHKVGTHRRVLPRDLVAHRERQAIESRATLDALAAEAQELDMGY
jgi:excisionase family DNA binding protein